MDGSDVVSDEDLATCVRVLSALATPEGGISDAYREPRCKPLRCALQLYLEDAQQRQFHGQKPDKYMQRKEKKREKHAKQQQQRALDREAEDKTRMRAERLKMLGSLEESATDNKMAALTLVPDGAVETESAPQLLTDASAADVSNVTLTTTADAASATELHTHRQCYTCKLRFRQLHHFYASLCPECATLNYAKRLQSADLSGRTFLITGGRVKIGFQCVLKLLRCGARVLVTSRFPADTAARFAAVTDSSTWLSRLRCYGLDLRDLSSLERFCAHLVHSGQRLDGIINNACQTIRRPAAYYAHLLPFELQPAEWSSGVRALLADHEACFGTARECDEQNASAPALEDAGRGAGENHDFAAAAPAAAAPTAAATAVAPPAAGGATCTCPVCPASSMLATSADSASSSVVPAAQVQAAAIVPSALWSQAPLWSAEDGVMQPDEGTAADFPLGLRDVNGQQLDVRRTNSWLLKLGDVSTPEAAEVLAINTLAPFILNSRLRGLLERCPADRRFVINVSAMEGKFYRYKTPNHPHTNMAKAALNMMTRTCAEDLAKSGVYMNSVDTGWINDEKPLEKAAAHAEAHHFQTPLDEIDAASRVLDPILSACNGEEAVFGKFLKDYRAVEW